MDSPLDHERPDQRVRETGHGLCKSPQKLARHGVSRVTVVELLWKLPTTYVVRFWTQRPELPGDLIMSTTLTELRGPMSARQPILPRPVGWPVVSVGRDRSLLTMRAASLATAGIAVRSLEPEQAEFPAHDGKPRIWVLCGSIEEATLVYLACTVRRYSAVSRLLLVEWLQPAGGERCLFHRVLDSEADHGALAQAIRSYNRATGTDLGD